MGIFTWTDARLNLANRDGEYKDSEICMYGEYCKIVCPDDSVIATTYYHGDGMFGCTDAYDVVVDWNRDDLKAIAERKKNDSFDKELYDIAIMYADGSSEEDVTRYVKKQVKEGKMSPYLIDEWKRNIGIMLCCDDEDNLALKYPLKITRTKEEVKYKDLYPSFNTQ